MAKEKLGKNRGEKQNAVVIYKEGKDIRLDVRLEKETVWLTQKQMADLFAKDVRTINEHIKNVYKEGELSEEPTIRKFRIVQNEGGRKVVRPVDLYNLDVIISVGYRVKSQRGVQFRIWATQTLKKFLVKGYAINEKRLSEARDRFRELQQAVTFLTEKSKNELLSGKEGEILSLLASYSKTFTILDEYDKGTMTEAKGGKGTFILAYEDALQVIATQKQDLIAKKEASDIFGNPKDNSFEGIIRGLYQTFGGQELYKTLESKAAHLLYFTIKDHPFSDGNKRTASFLFVYFLNRNNALFRGSGERKINDNALAALVLLVAESDPKEKDVMIALITQLLK